MRAHPDSQIHQPRTSPVELIPEVDEVVPEAASVAAPERFGVLRVDSRSSGVAPCQSVSPERLIAL